MLSSSLSLCETKSKEIVPGDTARNSYGVNDLGDVGPAALQLLGRVIDTPERVNGTSKLSLIIKTG